MTPDASIALLLPTRQRASWAVEALQSIAATVARPDLLRVVVGVDDDDRDSAEAARSVSVAYSIALDVKGGTRGMNHRAHLMLPAAAGYDVVGFFADDVRMVTPGWDSAVREAAAMMPGGYGVMYFQDPLHPMSPTYPLVTAAMIGELGFFFEPYTPFWFSDSWLEEIGSMIGCLLPLNAVLANPYGKGKTRHMRELAFWADWFNATRPRRLATAQRLIRRMYPGQPALTITLFNDLARRAQWQHWRTERLKKSEHRLVAKSRSMESGEPPETYLAAKRIAIEYVRKMRADLGIEIDDQFSVPAAGPPTAR